MDDSKILIVGANGQLGLALQAKYPNAQAVDSKVLDITDQNAVASFDWTNVKTIINASGYTNVDGAETHEGRIAAWNVNSTGVRNLAATAILNDLTLIHISSDYVFDGAQQNHSESEPFSPLGVYGQSKAAGDLVTSLVPKHYLLRTTWVIGDGNNFVRTMLSLGERGIAPSVVHDQIGRLTFASELVKTIDHLLATNAEFGTYNTTNSGDPASWADITREIFALAGYKLEVTNTTTADYFASKANASPRPLNSVMNLDKLAATGFVFTDWRDDLSNYIKQETN